MSTAIVTPMSAPSWVGGHRDDVLSSDSRRSETRSHLRLTARGRAVFSVLGAIMISAAAAGVILGGASATASGESAAATFDYVQIEAGQSLWQVAQSIAPNADPRDVIYDIVNLNQLQTAEVQPGQQIAIPAKYGD